MHVKDPKANPSTMLAIYDKSNSESRIQACLDFARPKFGALDPLVFSEKIGRGVSKTPEGLRALLAEVRKGTVGTLIVANVAALSRDISVLMNTCMILDQCGAALYLVSGQRVNRATVLIGSHLDDERSARSRRINSRIFGLQKTVDVV